MAYGHGPKGPYPFGLGAQVMFNGAIGPDTKCNSLMQQDEVNEMLNF